MANINISRIFAEELESMLRETPGPFQNANWLFEQLGGPRLTYQQRLDKQPRNHYGELIPRIVTVRRHIRETKSYKPTW